MTRPICLIGWASQPDIQFVCDDAWSTPKWGKPEEQTVAPGVHVADDGDRLYTFDHAKVTCELCLAKMAGPHQTVGDREERGT